MLTSKQPLGGLNTPYCAGYANAGWWDPGEEFKRSEVAVSAVTETSFPNYTPSATNPPQPTYTSDQATSAYDLPRTLQANISKGIHRATIAELRLRVYRG